MSYGAIDFVLEPKNIEIANQQVNPKVIAISPFALSEESGHSLIDDEFYIKHLQESDVKFEFYTSLFSAKRILVSNPTVIDSLKVIDNFGGGVHGGVKYVQQIKIPDDSTVIFFGYSEEIITIFLLLNWNVSFKLILVATNNVSLSRINRYRYPLIIFFSFVRFRLKRFVVHTRFEKKCISSLLPWVSSKCFVKTHHLMVRRGSFLNENDSSVDNRNKISISFFGPSSSEKPIEPLLEFIKLDTKRRFQFRLYNVGRSSLRKCEDAIRSQSNVSMINQYLSYDEYNQAFSRSDLIFMPHNREFEGKLSGNLCDCIALGVPFISNLIEPINEMIEKFGEIGFVVDMTQPDWVDYLIEKINFDSVMAKKGSISSAQKVINHEMIRYSLNEALGFDSSRPPSAG